MSGSPSLLPRCYKAFGIRTLGVPLAAAILMSLVGAAGAGDLGLLRANPDPYGYPRPAPQATHVPVSTSFYFEIGFPDKVTTDTVPADSVSAQIESPGAPARDLLLPGQRFAPGYAGKFIANPRRTPGLAVYIDGPADLEPSTTYTVSVRARSRGGAVLSAEQGAWQFTTAEPDQTHSLEFQIDLAQPSVRWRGGFFTGFCKPSFCTSASNRIAGYELMAGIRNRYPAAWSLQRDFWMTGMQHQPTFLSGGLPNVVRERETRRIAAVEQHEAGTLLNLEDFFGHPQYGIASDRPLRADYHAGDEVLMADGVNHATATVIKIVADTPTSKRLLVTRVDAPPDDWRIAYSRPLPEKEDPHAPGLFPPGGCYLRKIRPAGTPCYYWGRIDAEWDIAVRRFGRRLVVNFADAPGDLSIDGRNWNFPQDYVEYHGVVRAYTDHLIERYGDACLDFVWSVLNEPDLAAAFWRSGDWNELQKFYDYTVDAVLRSFEDHGYDSNQVRVGGLEIGAIFGVHIERPVLQIFLSHCSPTATCPGALTRNAAVADTRLDGRRSKRVEDLCRATGGQGSPCDFISVHSYNASPTMAAKLIRAKEIALDTDADYYADLWVNSFESCPGWAPPPDVAAADSYLGNGYFPTWCADVARRQLDQAARDARYGFGESIVTFWPWPNQNFGGQNAATRVVAVDDDRDGRTDRSETIAMPILHFLGLLAGMGDTYQVLPEQAVAGHVVSGFTSRDTDALRVLLYAHHAQDIQSRSKDAFRIALKLEAVPWPQVRVREYRFDKQHNSYYHLGVQLRDRLPGGSGLRRPAVREVEQLIADLSGGDPERQIAAVRKALTFGEVPEGVLAAGLQLYERTRDQSVRAALEQAARQFQTRQVCYRPEELAQVRELSELHVTHESTHAVARDGALMLSLSVAANGANFVVIEPAATP